MTKINEPHMLSIKAGDMQDIEQLELGTIDVSREQKYKDVVFCVYSEKAGQLYYLQLAHTTNIGFTYTIYKASKTDSEGITYLGDHFKQGDVLSGNYLNMATGGKYATNAYHTTTYPAEGSPSYDKVQQSAEPLYWKSANQEALPQVSGTDSDYVNYYILRISWDETVQNNKETDMIYLMAG